MRLSGIGWLGRDGLRPVVEEFRLADPWTIPEKSQRGLKSDRYTTCESECGVKQTDGRERSWKLRGRVVGKYIAWNSNPSHYHTWMKGDKISTRSKLPPTQ